MGEMNGTEAKYAEHLGLLQFAGEVLLFKFEALTFRLADKTAFTPDFYYLDQNAEMVLVDVKGTKKGKGKRSLKRPYTEGDAAVKIKCAAEQYPEFTWLVAWLGDDGWCTEQK